MNFKLELHVIVQEAIKLKKYNQSITQVEYEKWNNIINKKIEQEKGKI